MYSVGIAYLLWLVSGCGALGFHRFYLGKIPTGLLWMFTGGMFMAGSIYDFFTLPGQVREANIRDALYKSQIGSNSQHRGQSWRYVNDGGTRIVKEHESVERTILRIAKRNKGIITPSEIALEADISIDEAKRDLEALVNKGIAEIRVRQSGTIVYTLPEFMDTDSPLEDF
ncbi:NINE protein [Breznakiella homolactica]|uniref:NINE protein n=1 Tax=Breznakiella homolactica TaxID=2798577 RepID=A0A7T7XLV0_9SPIR|nr:NINE protein [Breznakiella homolactica]QQO08593.1 NINE protein [Breznakiella homolactica]